MTILFFSRLFYPHIGGVEKHVWEISKILIKKGHKVFVISEKHDSKLKNFEIINKIKIYRISIENQNWFKKFQIWLWLFQHRNLIKQADIIHCHDVFFWYFPFRFLFPRKPVYTTFHGYESYPVSKKAVWIRKLSEELSFGNICIGAFIKKWYGTKPTFVSYGGVNRIKNEELKIKNYSSAVFIGRLDEQTGIKTYIDAVKLIRKKIPDFKFEIIGDGKFREDIERDFKILGFQKNSERYFRKYRFAFVSGYLSILEAMVEKRLVFAIYNNPLKKDYLTLTPFAKFINIINSKEKLSSLVVHFLTHSEKEKKMVDRAFEWVKNQSWEDVVNLYLSLWQKGRKVF